MQHSQNSKNFHLSYLCPYMNSSEINYTRRRIFGEIRETAFPRACFKLINFILHNFYLCDS